MVLCFANALYSRHGRFLDLVLESVEGAELENEYSRLCGDVVADYSKKFGGQLAKSIDSANTAGKIDLAAQELTSERIATLLNLSAAGCKRGCTSMSDYQKRIEDLVHLLIGGMLSKA